MAIVVNATDINENFEQLLNDALNVLENLEKRSVPVETIYKLIEYIKSNPAPTFPHLKIPIFKEFREYDDRSNNENDKIK